jgi:pyruvate/2-oxoglutarate dehydrogenase complex dihydrolipoamide acyltransferase (E2) component
MGVSVAEGTVVAWRVEPGDRIEAEATIAEISTDKIDTEVPSPASGVVAEIIVPVGETVDVGTVMARIAVGGDGVAPVPAGEAPEPLDGDTAGPPITETKSSIPTPAAAPAARNGNRRYSPVVQRIAAEHGIDLSQVPGTGRDGRVRKQDVLAFVEVGPTEEPPLHIESPYRPEPVTPAPAPASPVIDGGGLSRMRRQIGEHMKRSLDTAATCTTWIEVDMSRVEAARARLGVTALAFVARASIDAMREHPALNAWLEGDRYTRHTDVNLGIAVSLGDDGLIVPVIPRAQELSVEGLAARVKDIARRARARQLTPDDVTGGTFTITNPGQYGSIMATPIINQPQVAILDLEAVIKRAVVVTDAAGNDSIAIRPMTILGLSWDHRALDGALSAQFLATIKRNLESVS